MPDEINDCGRCGEDACLVSFNGKHMVRVRRSSKCKHYRPRELGRSCMTEVRATATDAVSEWNATHGAVSPPVREIELRLGGGRVSINGGEPVEYGFGFED